MLYRLQNTSKDDKTDPQSHTNYQYLSTPEKLNRLKKLHDQCKVMKQQLSRTRQKLEQALEQRAVIAGEDLHEELEAIVNDQSPFIAETYPEHTFARIFLGEPKKSIITCKSQIHEMGSTDDTVVSIPPLLLSWCLWDVAWIECH